MDDIENKTLISEVSKQIKNSARNFSAIVSIKGLLLLQYLTMCDDINIL